MGSLVQSPDSVRRLTSHVRPRDLDVGGQEARQVSPSAPRVSARARALVAAASDAVRVSLSMNRMAPSRPSRRSGTKTSPHRGVLGVGIDLVELTEFRDSILRRHANIRRVFTPRELAACEGPSRLARLAARFAAKEAAF